MKSNYLKDPQRDKSCVDVYVYVCVFISANLIFAWESDAQAEYLSNRGVLVSRYENLKA